MTRPTIRLSLSAAVLAVTLPLAGATWAQGMGDGTPAAQAADAPGAQVAPPGRAATDGMAGTCPEPDTRAEAATQPDPGENATAPENSGTTGWSGGTGGSQLGTNAQGAVDSSPTWQPPTARGLDLAGLPEPVPAC